MNPDPRTTQNPQQNPPQDPQRLLFVMLVVLIVCGGNGVGIITAALIWKYTGRVVAAIVAVTIITLLALAGALALILCHSRTLKERGNT
jgi:Na+/citrate or Na+/malate symporter